VNLFNVLGGLVFVAVLAAQSHGWDKAPALSPTRDAAAVERVLDDMRDLRRELAQIRRNRSAR
jgi:hypothetical protein